MLVLAKELVFSADTLPPAPPELDRKETLLGDGAVADRKPNAWASEDLPKWLAAQLAPKFANGPAVQLDRLRPGHPGRVVRRL